MKSTDVLRGLRSRVAALLGRDSSEDTEDDAGEPAESDGFMPSRLDASVLFAHGKATTVEEPDDETLEELEAEARELERKRRED
jgi:hypothetical protein